VMRHIESTQIIMILLQKFQINTTLLISESSSCLNKRPM
jgi:hypothetical protein